MSEPLERMIEWMQQKAISDAELARRVGSTPQAINNWKRRGWIPKSAMSEVAKAIGCSLDWLAYGDAPTLSSTARWDESRLSGGADAEPPNVVETHYKVGKVPLISWVRAGEFVEAIDNFQPGDAEDWIDTTVTIRAHTFALRVSGDSMEPEFYEGCIVVVEPDLEPQHRDFVVVRNSENGVTLKQLVDDGGEWFLRPLNRQYPTRPLGNGKIIGVVRENTRKYR